MHIAVDQDDVMLEFFPNVLECFEREYGIKPKFDGSPWGPDAVAFTHHPALLASGYDDWWGWLRERDWLWGIAPAVPGAIGGVKQLRAMGHYVEMVTSKPLWAEPQVWRWLGKWRPPFQKVTIVEPGQSKVDYTSADLIIDDRRSTCDEFEAAGRKAIHFERGAQPTTATERVRVAISWPAVLHVVQSLNLEVVHATK